MSRPNTALVSANDILPIVVSGATRLVKRHPVKVGSYVLGLILCFFFSGLTISATKLAAYEAALPPDGDVRQMNELSWSAQNAYWNYYNAKGWFSCDATCQMLKTKHTEAQRKADQAAAKVNTQYRQARGILGIFSTAGVQEARELFWSLFSRGVAASKRATMWDAFFIGMRSMGRDEGFASYIINMLVAFFSNFFMSMIMSVIMFAWRVWDVIRSFNAGWLYGTVFWLGALLAAGSFCLTIVAGVGVAVGGSVAGVVYVAATQAQQGRRIGGGQSHVGRMHYE